MPTASLRYYSSNADPATLSATTTSGATTISIASKPGTWPSNVPYTIGVDRGFATEELMLVTAESGTGPYTLTVTRGYNGTDANAHTNTSSPSVEHCVGALDFSEANTHASTSSVSTAHGAVGQSDVTNGYVDLSSGQTVGGAKTFSSYIALNISTATSAGGTIPALMMASTITDNFLLHGQAVHHYGLTSYNWNDGNGVVGANLSLSGYFGLSFTTGGVERIRVQKAGTTRFYGDGASGEMHIGLYDTTAAQTTPNKYLRSQGGQFQVINHAYNAILLSVTDAGVTTSTGNLFEGANRVYSAGNAPPYPVTSVATRTGAVTLTAADIGSGSFPAGNFNHPNGSLLQFVMSSGNAGYLAASGTTLNLRGGTSGYVLRNNADNASIVTLSDAGALTVASTLTASNGFTVTTGAVGVTATSQDYLTTAQLGGTTGNSVLAHAFRTNNQTNNFQENIWLYRRATGTDWTTAQWFNGISIDSSFVTPATAKTYWRRDPQQNFQAFGTDAVDMLTVTNAGVSIAGTLNTTGNVGIGSVLTFANPGVGNDTAFVFTKSSDSAGITVREHTSDATWYAFTMGDNPDGGDAFTMQWTDWQNPGSGWTPFQYMAETAVYNGPSTFNGNVNIPFGAFITSNNGSFGNRDYLRTTTPTKSTGTGTITCTVNASGYTGGVAAMWITLDSSTTFKWGYGNSSNTAQQTGLAVGTGGVTLSNGIIVSFSAATGGVTGDTWTMRAYPGGVLTASSTSIGDVGYGSGYAGIKYSTNGVNDYMLLGNATDTYLNSSSGGSIFFRFSNADAGRWTTSGLRIGDGNSAGAKLDVQGASIISGRLIASGGTGAGTGTNYSAADLEVRSTNGGGRSPNISLHWQGVVASQIIVESDGTVSIRDNPGTGYEKFKALSVRTTAGLVVGTTANFGGSMDGYGIEVLDYGLRAQAGVTGGGTITYDTTNGLKWTSRFIVISQGNGTSAGTSGYFDITFPAAGTVIPGSGGSGNITTTANGINFVGNGWGALWYVLPIGSAQTSLDANFRVTLYTSGMTPPAANWILLAVCNGDEGSVRLATGHKLTNGASVPTSGMGGSPLYDVGARVYSSNNPPPAVGAAPTGSVMMYSGDSSTPPTGWLMCDGTAVSRTTYSALFAVTGTVYGTGDGSTTFNLPDLRTRFPKGKATTATATSTGGATTHGHSNGSSSHSHSLVSGHSHTGSTGGHSHSVGTHSHAFSATHTHTFSTGTTNLNHSHSVPTGTNSGTSGNMNASNPHSHNGTSDAAGPGTSDAGGGVGTGTSTDTISTASDTFASASVADYGASASNDPLFITFNYIIKT